MASTVLKAFLLVAVFSCIFAQDTGAKTFPAPDPSWTEYQVKSCCPKGFLEVLNYCVKCTAPNVFDPVDQKCKPCPEGFQYSNVTLRCECFKCDPPRALNPANGQCECKAVNGTQMFYNK